MPNSVLEAIKLGHWNFEPEKVNRDEFEATRSLPGSDGKLDILVQRVQRGLPLWHPEDRLAYDDNLD